MFFAAAVALATPQVGAQTAGDPTESGVGASQSASGGWRRYPNERHVFVRAAGTVAARLTDPYSQGTLAPPGAYVSGGFGFLHVGPTIMGPSLGVQAGFDPVGVQVAVQPGWQMWWRLASRLAFTARVEIPILITRGACPVDYVPADMGFQGAGFGLNRNRLPVPATGYCPTVTVGVEAAPGLAFYVTNGVALTAEAVFDFYVGDSLLPFPLLGGAVGLMVDYEVLP